MITGIHEMAEVYPSSNFKFNKATGTFYADFENCKGCLRQLFKAGFEIGFGIRSVKTGKIAWYLLNANEQDCQNHIITYKFIAHQDSIDKIPEVKNASRVHVTYRYTD